MCTVGVECSRKVASGRRVAGAIRFLVNARVLQIECARVLYETLLAPVLTYGSETMLWKEKERPRIKTAYMDSLRGLPGIRRMGRVPNARIRELCRMMNGIDERIEDDVLRWFGHMERMGKDRIAKRLYVRECAGSHSVGRPRKR